MNKPMTMTIATLGFLVVTAAASAQTPAPPQSRHPGTLQQLGLRLRDGVQSGQLTKGEAARLRARLAAFRQHREALGAHLGTRTPEQRRALAGERRRLSRMLFRLTHNRVRR